MKCGVGCSRISLKALQMALETGGNDAAQARAGAATAGVVSDRVGAVDRHEPSSGSSRFFHRLAFVRTESGQHLSSQSRCAGDLDASDGCSSLSEVSAGYLDAADGCSSLSEVSA